MLGNVDVHEHQRRRIQHAAPVGITRERRRELTVRALIFAKHRLPQRPVGVPVFVPRQLTLCETLRKFFRGAISEGLRFRQARKRPMPARESPMRSLGPEWRKLHHAARSNRFIRLRPEKSRVSRRPIRGNRPRLRVVRRIPAPNRPAPDAWPRRAHPSIR